MPNEYNDSDMRETNTQANETSTYFEASNSFLETDRAKEEADEAKEYGMDSDLAGDGGGNDDDNNNRNNSGSSNTSDTMNSLSSLTGGATAALSGAFASVIAVVAVVAVAPAMSSGYTPLTADFTSLTAIVREVEDEEDLSINKYTDICYTIELGSEDEEFEVTPDLYSDINISLTNRYTDRTYTLEEMGGLSGRFEDVKEGTKYSVSLEYDGCLIGQQYITTSSTEQGPELKVVYRCNCSVDGTFHLMFFFGGDVSAFSNFSATLTDSYGNVSEWVPGDDFVDEMGSVIYTDVDADPEGDAYRFFFVNGDLEGEDADEVYAAALSELDEEGYIYVTAVQKIKVIGAALGGKSATLTITYDVYGDTQTLVAEVGI
ncbi:MAG: hypothetical protein LUD47_00415 [Clostridia bacterium]|nr:hypothetical protein [Clostridia bacterium]